MRAAAAAAAVTVGAAGGCLAVARVEGAMVTAEGAGEGGRACGGAREGAAEGAAEGGREGAGEGGRARRERGREGGRGGGGGGSGGGRCASVERVAASGVEQWRAVPVSVTTSQFDSVFGPENSRLFVADSPARTRFVVLFVSTFVVV